MFNSSVIRCDLHVCLFDVDNERCNEWFWIVTVPLSMVSSAVALRVVEFGLCTSRRWTLTLHCASLNFNLSSLTLNGARCDFEVERVTVRCWVRTCHFALSHVQIELFDVELNRCTMRALFLTYNLSILNLDVARCDFDFERITVRSWVVMLHFAILICNFELFDFEFECCIARCWIWPFNLSMLNSSVALCELEF